MCSPKKSTKQIHKILLKKISQLGIECYVTFTSDDHLNEYLGNKDQRVKFLTGFTGSNGTALTSTTPCLLTDSRYFIQAKNQSFYPLSHDSLSEALSKYKTVSFDIRKISSKRFAEIQTKLVYLGINFVGIDNNLVDLCVTEYFEQNPEDVEFFQFYSKSLGIEVEYLENHIFCHFIKNDLGILKYFRELGISDICPKHNVEALDSQNKLSNEEPNQENVCPNVTGSSYRMKLKLLHEKYPNTTIIFSELDTIAYFLNIRGSDIEYNPVFYGYLVITPENNFLYTDAEIYLQAIEIRKYSNFESSIDEIYTDVLISGDCNQYIFKRLERANIATKFTDEFRLKQATKNNVELAGFALSYLYDGISLVELFSYLENNIEMKLSEIDVSNKLLELKKKQKSFVQPSFETISSTGANAAIVHHKAGETILDKNEIFLLDSGSHYLFGTTDTTRTLFFGKENKNLEEIIRSNTLVLMCHLNAMMNEYSLEDTFAKMDDLGRKALKDCSMEYGHGLSHGVGHFLCCHESPPRVSSRSKEPIQPGMVFSIEPGFYKEGEFGIRIENLVFSKNSKNGIDFSNITLVPYQLNMIDMSLLNNKQIEYLNSCNERCYRILKKYLSVEGKAYLKKNTQQIDLSKVLLK